MLNSCLDIFEGSVKSALDKTLTGKVKKDTSINEEEYDSTDGILKDGADFINIKIEKIKSTIKNIIGTDLITMITQVVKTLNRHVKSGRNITLTYIKKMFELLETISGEMVTLAII